MISSFPLPVGAKSNVKELEYISAIHQTCLPNLRKNATISTDDIKLYLQSRYGLKLSTNHVIDIANGIGGTTSGSYSLYQEIVDNQHAGGSKKLNYDNDDSNRENENDSSNNSDESSIPIDNEEIGYLDLVQVVSGLIIPTLIRSANRLEMRTVNTNNNNLIRNQKEQLWKRHEDENIITNDGVQLQKIESLDIQKEIEDDTIIYNHIIGSVLKRIQSLSTPHLSCFRNNLTTHTFLTKEYVKELLLLVGEIEASNNDNLITQMIECAAGTTYAQVEGSCVIFNEQSFARALTSDVSRWVNAMEDNLTTSFYDVFGCEPTDRDRITDLSKNNKMQLNDGRSECDVELNSMSDQPLQREFESIEINSTCPSIDYVVDSFYSIYYVMALWIFYIFSAAVYVAFLNLSAFNVVECGQSFGCELLNRIWSWASFALILTVGGLIIILPISIANDPYQVRWNWAILSSTILVLYCILPFVLYTSIDAIPKSWAFDITTIVYLGFGSIILLVFIPINLIRYSLNQCKLESSGELSTSSWMIPTHLATSAAIKSAATIKINQMLENAYHVHETIDLEGDDTIDNVIKQYLFKEDEYCQCGGLLWSWMQLVQKNNNLLREYGVLLHARLFVGQQGQILTLILFIWFMFYETEVISNHADNNIAQVQSLPHSVAKDQLLLYLPSSSIIRTSLYIGTGIGATVGILLIVLYLPSTVNTILRLRCGLLPSLHNVHMKKYRYSADTMYYNVSNMIFGLVGAMSLFLCFFGGIIFFFQWKVSQRFMMSVLAWLLGLTITLAIKTIVVKFIRKVQYKCFYRKMPKSANIFSLTMESWTLGLAGGVLLGRFTQFLLASAFWIGRIDVNFLDEDVHMMGYRFDAVPTHFRKEILAHEAHRHPLIDRLASIYLMRLKHNKDFLSDAGCAWRRIFVQVLMPWLMKYRQKNEAVEIDQ